MVRSGPKAETEAGTAYWHTCYDTRLVPERTAQVVTNNAHAICNDRRMANDAMQWHIIDAACRQQRMRGNGDMLGFAEFAESRHTGIKYANHGLRWQFFHQDASDPGVRIDCAAE